MNRFYVMSRRQKGDTNPRTIIAKEFVLVLLAGTIAFASLGCGLMGGSGTNSDGNTAAAGTEDKAPAAPGSRSTGESGPDAASGPCVNQYYPIEPGVKKKYVLSSKIGEQDAEMTLTQGAPEGGSFTETRTLSSGTTVTTPWKCTDEGIRTAQYENMIDMKSGNFTMETVESSGTTIPASWKKGDEWNSDYKIKANIKAGPVTASADGTVSITNQLVAEHETVKVKGGEFDAARVDAEIDIMITVKGTKAPKQTIKLSRWYSPKVGLVKQEVYGSFGNETMEYAGTAKQ